jgi:hypothetical protein
MLKVTGVPAAMAADGVPAGGDEVAGGEATVAAADVRAERRWGAKRWRRKRFRRGSSHLRIGRAGRGIAAGTEIQAAGEGKLTRGDGGRRKGMGSRGERGTRAMGRAGRGRGAECFPARLHQPRQRAGRRGQNTRAEEREARQRPASSWTGAGSRGI